MTLADKAAKLFKSFHHRPAREDEIVMMQAIKDDITCMKIGELDAVIYRTEDEPKGHIHRFTKTDRPLIWITADGNQMFVTGGRYRFTDRGFIA
jgi:hypothetical protein